MRIKPRLVVISLIVAWLAWPVQLSSQQAPTPSLRLASPHRHAKFSTLVEHGGFKYWDKGFLITYARDGTLAASPSKPVVVLYDSSGQVAQEAVVWFKDAAKVSVGDAAVTNSGKLLVTGGTISPDGVIANFIASIDNTGHVDKVIRTTPFLPVYICSAADDGTVWSYGFDRDEAGRWIQGSLQLRQFSFDYGQVKATLDPSVLDQTWSKFRGAYPGAMGLRCNSQKVVLYNGTSTQLVEFDLRSDKLRISEVAPLPDKRTVRITGFALTDSGEMFASLHYRASDPPVSGLFKLTFGGGRGGKWEAVDGTVGPFLRGSVAKLIGANGNDLLYTKQLLDGEVYWSKTAPKQ